MGLKEVLNERDCATDVKSLSAPKISSSVIWVIGIVLGLASGFAVSYLYFQTQLNSSAEQETALKANVADLEKNLQKTNEELSTVKAASEGLRARLSDAQRDKERAEGLLATADTKLSEALRDLDAKKLELKNAQDQLQLEKVRSGSLSRQMSTLEKSLDQLKSDKLLLAELRKDVPSTRKEHRQYWNDLRNVAVKVDSSLGDRIDKILANLDSYFDWGEKAPGVNASYEAWGRWLLSSPAAAYDYSKAVNDFLNDSYFVMIRDIDAALVTLR